MPTPYGCALEEVYSDWNFKKPDTLNTQTPGPTNQQLHPQLHPAQHPVQQPAQPSQNAFQKEEDTSYIPNNNGIRTFCPNCQTCLNANDVLQQRIIETAIWPRPRWTPQYPNAYVPYDPFNRYWMNNVPESQREEFANVIPGGTPFLTNSGPFPNMFANVYENFGNAGGSETGGGLNVNTEVLLQVILFILIALFIIQLVECLYARCTSGGST
jgi:hypothetical protein